jgi:hypothetical protein
MHLRLSPATRFVLGGLSVILGFLVVLIVQSPPTGEGEPILDAATADETTSTSTSTSTTTTPVDATTTTTEAPINGWVDPESSGEP